VTRDDHPTYPVQLRIAGWSVLVVGGGRVARRKVGRLLEAGAQVTVVAPTAVEAIADLAATGALQWAQRGYVAGESAAYKLVFAATDDRGLNLRVAADATAAGVPANVADDPKAGTFYLPAQVLRGNLQVNIATEGDAPFFARRLRERWARKLGPDWVEQLAEAARFRAAVLAATDDPRERERLFDRFVAATFETDTATDADTVTPCPEETWRVWIAEIIGI